jgi:hypothetical protein
LFTERVVLLACHDSSKLGAGGGPIRRPAIFAEIHREVLLPGSLIVSWNLEDDLVKFEEGQEYVLKSYNCLLVCESQKHPSRLVVFTNQKIQA